MRRCDRDHRGHGLGLLLARNLLRPDGGRVELVSDGADDVRHHVARTTIGRPEQRTQRRGEDESGPHLLTHEDRVGDGEQHDDSADEGGHLPPGQHEALGKRKRARQGLRRGVVSTMSPVDWRDGFSSTPVASWYSSDGEKRRTLSSRRALASTTSAVGSAAGTGCTVSATSPAIKPPKSVNTSQMAIPANAAVAARRVTTDSIVASANHSAM